MRNMPQPSRRAAARRAPACSGRSSAGRLPLLLLLLAYLLGAAAGPPAEAQFHQIGGKNKVTHDTFDWKVYESPHFMIYYYPAEEAFLERLVSYAESAYLKVSTDLNYQLKFKVPVFFYKTHGEFEQTNITMEFLPEYVGAFATPSRNRIVIPIDDPPDLVQGTLTHELVHIFQYDILFQSDVTKAARSSPPLWIMEGLAEHIGEDWSTRDEMIIRDAVLNDLVPPILELDVLTFLTYKFGQAAFDYIASEYGVEGVRDFLMAFRRHMTTRDMEKVLDEAFKVKPDDFDAGFRHYLREKYIRTIIDKDEPGDYGKEIGLKGEGEEYVHTWSPAVSPSGELVAVLTNKFDEVDLVLISAADGQLVKNLTKGFTNDYEYLIIENYSGKNDVSWSPQRDQIAVFVRRERGRDLLLLNALTGRKLRQVTLPLDECASPAFSPDGGKLLLAGNREGVVDIFEYDLESGGLRNVTEDEFWDSNPTYSPDGKSCVYNRRINGHEKIVRVSLGEPADKVQLTFGEHDDIQPAYSPDGRRLYFSSDESGIYNFCILDLETRVVSQQTNVVSGIFDPVPMAGGEGKERVAFGTYFKGRFRLYEMEIGEPLRIIPPPEEPPSLEEQKDFQPALDLTLDEEEKKEYPRYKFFVEGASAIAGVSDAGDFLTASYISLSDMAGDQRILVVAESVYTYTNIEATYFNTRGRMDWGVHGFDLRDYFVFYDPVRIDFERTQTYRRTGASLFALYPFNKFHRLEGSVGYLIRQHYQPVIENNQIVDFTPLEDDLPVVGAAFVGDTARYKSFGPIHGRRYEISVEYAPKIGGRTEGFTDVSGEFRNYFQLTERSLIAHRLFGFFSFSDVPNFRVFGGMNTMRGYDFRSFVGSRAAFSNLELRFPLVDEIRFPFGLRIREIRGNLFWDVGTSWWDEQDYEFIGDDENGKQVLLDGASSVGMGFHILLGPFQLHWDFAKTWDLQDFADGFDTAFWIGLEF